MISAGNLRQCLLVHLLSFSKKGIFSYILNCWQATFQLRNAIPGYLTAKSYRNLELSQLYALGRKKRPQLYTSQITAEVRYVFRQFTSIKIQCNFAIMKNSNFQKRFYLFCGATGTIKDTKYVLDPDCHSRTIVMLSSITFS